MLQRIESILSPQQQRRPLPSLLSLSFFYEYIHLILRRLTWNLSFLPASQGLKIGFNGRFTILHSACHVRPVSEYRVYGGTSGLTRHACSKFLKHRACYVTCVILVGAIMHKNGYDCGDLGSGFGLQGHGYAVRHHSDYI